MKEFILALVWLSFGAAVCIGLIHSGHWITGSILAVIFLSGVKIKSE